MYGEQAASGKLFSQLSDVLGPDTAKTIQNVVTNIHHSRAGVVALILGTVGMLLSAAGITSQLQTALNAILGVVPDPKGGLKRTVYVKIKNMLLVVLGGVIVVASLIVSTTISGIGAKVQQQTGIPPVALELLNTAVSLAIMTLLLFFVYRVIPDVVVPPKVLLVTSLCVTILFVIGKVILAIIIGRNGTASAYGAAATLISLLLWIYYSGQILFLGAEGIKVYAFNHSLTYRPKKFTLRRTTLQLDGNNVGSRLGEAWVRGFRKGSSK